MKLATWNVNSIKARLERTLAFLQRWEPDVLCLQELKCEESAFPFEAIQGLGYHAMVLGQRTYNGVAVLSKSPMELVAQGFNDGDEDAASRFLLVRTHGMFVGSTYVPNGQAPGTDKYEYKLKWLKRFKTFLTKTRKPTEPIVIAGDFNVAPEDRDVHDPKAWEGSVLVSPPERAGLKDVLSFGLEDTFRKHHSEGGFYSWWDYRMLAFPKNKGLRIDQIYCTKPLLKYCNEASIDRNERKGKLPSDHAPVFANFEENFTI